VKIGCISGNALLYSRPKRSVLGKSVTIIRSVAQ